MNRPNFRLALIGLVLGVILALALVPQTRLLLKMQASSPAALKASLNDCPAPQTAPFVASHPNDYQIQLAAPFDIQAQTQLQYARSLIPRFPGSASLRANILRYAMLREINLWRSDDYLLQEQPVVKPPVWEKPTTPAELAEFDADAAAGERLDPDNAYFPFMRSVGLFMAHRDAEGLAAVERASRKTLWREYCEDEVQGHWRISDHLKGGRETLASMSAAAALLLPHYARLRSVARIVTYKAVLLEQAGHPLQGLALRRALARCGYLMTTQSPIIIGNLVGIAISEVARSRPGGVPPLKSGLDAVRDQRTRRQILQQRLDTYVAYARRLGQEDAAREAQTQFAEEQQIVHADTFTAYTMGQKTTDFTRLLVSLVCGWALITNLLTLGLLGLAAWGLSHLPRIREGRPLSAGAGVGIGIALFFGLVALALLHEPPPEGGENIFLGVFMDTLLPLAGLAIFAVLRPAFRKPLGRGIVAGVVTLAILWAIGALSAWKMASSYDIVSLMTSFGGSAGLLSSGDSQNTPLPTQILQGSVIGLLVPVLLIVVLAVGARSRRVPLSVGLVRGFCAAALPTFCVLALAYGGLLLWTARQESTANYALMQSLQGEGQYIAQLTGQTWPGPVR